MRSGPVPIGPSAQLERWSEAMLTDLKLWLLSDRLPPGVSFEELVEVVDLALKGCREELLEEALEEALEEVRSLKKELQDA